MTASPDTVARLTAALADRYRIERELGAGGMATVYLAEDLKHKRKVALKVLKPELAAVLGAERFVVEITTTAALQHPHILPLFDSGEAEGFLFYVMPFIDGETLRSKLDRETQFGIDEAVRITVDVASALHYAHEHGVIHRDIKPENILLHDGRPMVADFGIALALSAAAGGRMTETGLSLGTPHYMSPEQATAAKEITARSDVYSLGSVLYEMLAGNPPHTGATAQAIIMKIIAESADAVINHRKSVPPNVAAAVARAIEKVPADRFATAKEFADALGNPSYTTAVHAHGKGGRAASWRERAAVPFAVVAGLMLVAAVWGWLRPTPAPAVARLAISLPDSAALRVQPGNVFALSEDGGEIVYTGPGGGDVDLWVRRLNELTATRVPGTNGADSPFLSRDGEVVAFYRATPPALYTATLRGGPRQTLVSDSTLALGGDFGPDGSVYFVRSGGLRRVGASGGAVDEVTRVDTSAGEQRHGWIDVLPGGKGAIFTILRGSDEEADIAAVDLESHKITILVRATYARYAETGHLVYANADGGLFAIAFDAGTLTTSGTAIPIVAGLARGPDGIAHFAVSPAGMLLYGTGGGGADELVWVDRQGRVEPIDSTLTTPFASVALSPDGRTLAFTQGPGGMTTYNVWTKDLVAGTVQNLTIRGASYGASWSRDGRSLSYVGASATGRDLYSRRADGSGNPTLLFHADRAVEYGFLSPDGQWTIYQAGADGRASSRDIFARRMSGDTATVVLAASDGDESSPRLSPDGRWIAFVTANSASSRPNLFVSPFPDAGSSRVQVSIVGGRDPIWSSNGRELFYQTMPGNELVSARVEVSPTFRVLERTNLFSLRGFNLSRVSGDRTFDVSPDGRRFVMMRRKGDVSEQLVLVLNWFDELKAMGKR